MIRYRVGRRTTIPNLFILSGGKIDFADADVTITHSADALTLAGGQLLLPAGSASLPSLASAAQATDGIWFPANGQIQFAIAGIGQLRISTDALWVTSDNGALYFGASQTSVVLGREADNILEQGQDQAIPLAQTFKGPDGSGTDKNGANLTNAGGRPTGSGTPGKWKAAVSTPGTTGSSQQALVDRLVVDYGYVSFNPVDAAATPVAATAALKLFAYNKSVADDAVVTCPAITTNAFGWCIVGTTAASYTTFMVGSTGTVTLLTDKSADVVANADTDTKLCIGTAATQEPLQIKNRLGSTQVLNITIWYD